MDRKATPEKKVRENRKNHKENNKDPVQTMGGVYDHHNENKQNIREGGQGGNPSDGVTRAVGKDS